MLGLVNRYLRVFANGPFKIFFNTTYMRYIKNYKYVSYFFWNNA